MPGTGGPEDWGPDPAALPPPTHADGTADTPFLEAGGFVRTGLWAIVVLLATVGAWLTLTHLRSAVIASGEVRVEENRQVVQHKDGGVIAELLASNGDEVAAGQVLIRLGNTRQTTELRSLSAELNEMRARLARARAQQSGRSEIDFPEALLALARAEPQVAEAVGNQRSLFEAGLRKHEEELDVMRTRMRNAAAEIEAYRAQRQAIAEEVALVDRQMAVERQLLSSRMTSERQYMLVEREMADLKAQDHGIEAAVARLTGYREEARHEIERLRSQRSEAALKELQDVFLQLEQLRERRVHLEREVEASDIRAPVAGVVHGLAYHTIGGVVRPGEPILSVVPRGSELVIEAQLEASDIDQVHRGQEARVVFPAFDRGTTPEIRGRVVRVSADRFDDPERGLSFYTAEVAISDEQLGLLGDQALELMPGMASEVFLQTGQRTPLSYFLKPITDQLERALREG